MTEARIFDQYNYVSSQNLTSPAKQKQATKESTAVGFLNTLHVLIIAAESQKLTFNLKL